MFVDWGVFKWVVQVAAWHCVGVVAPVWRCVLGVSENTWRCLNRKVNSGICGCTDGVCEAQCVCLLILVVLVRDGPSARRSDG